MRKACWSRVDYTAIKGPSCQQNSFALVCCWKLLSDASRLKSTRHKLLGSSRDCPAAGAWPWLEVINSLGATQPFKGSLMRDRFSVLILNRWMAVKVAAELGTTVLPGWVATAGRSCSVSVLCFVVVHSGLPASFPDHFPAGDFFFLRSVDAQLHPQYAYFGGRHCRNGSQEPSTQLTPSPCDLTNTRASARHCYRARLAGTPLR